MMLLANLIQHKSIIPSNLELNQKKEQESNQRYGIPMKLIKFLHFIINMGPSGKFFNLNSLKGNQSLIF